MEAVKLCGACSGSLGGLWLNFEGLLHVAQNGDVDIFFEIVPGKGELCVV